MRISKKIAGITVILALMLPVVLSPAVNATPQSLSTIKIKNISNDKIIKDNEKYKVKNMKSTEDLGTVQDNVITMVDKKMLDTSDPATKDKLKKQLKADYDNEKFIFMYGDKANLLSENEIYKTLNISQGVVSQPVDDAARELQNRFFAYGVIKKVNGNVHMSKFYAAPDSDYNNLNNQMDFIVSSYKNLIGIKDETINQFNEKDKVKPQDLNSEDDAQYAESDYMDFGEYGLIQFTNYFDNSIRRWDYSVWDVKSSNTTIAGYSRYSWSWWQTDSVTTRHSVQPFSAETVIDHDPTSSESAQTATVNLTMAGPEIGWTFELYGKCDVWDDYHPEAGAKYARWIFDYYRWSNGAKGSFKTAPGSRFKNTEGVMAIDISNNIVYWDSYGYLNTPSTVSKYVGTYRYYFNDR